MTGILLRIIIYAAIAIFVYVSVRRLWRDLLAQFRGDDRAKRQRNVAEQQRAEVIELKRGADGVYRPPGKDEAQGR